MKRKTDEERILAREPGAIDEVLTRLAQDSKYLSIATRILGSPNNAEDVVQDALLSALKRWHQFRGGSKFSTWFCRIVITCALMQRRKDTRHVPCHLNDDKPTTARSPEEDYVEIERADRLWAALESLGLDSDKRMLKIGKQVAVSRLQRENSLCEIAQEFNIPLGTIKTSLYYVMQCLKEKLDGQV